MKRILTSLLCFSLVYGLYGQELVNNGATIVIEANASLVIQGSMENNGTVTNNGTLEIEGNLDNNNTITNNFGAKIIFSGSTNSTIFTSAALNLHSLELNKTGGAITTIDDIGGNDIILSDALTFGSNNFLALKGHNLSLGNIGSPIVGAGSDRFIITDGTGSLTKTGITDDGSFTFPVGYSPTEYNPATITNRSGSTEDISVRTLQEAYNDPTDDTSGSAGDAIEASWEVTGGSEIDVEFSWDGDDDDPADGFDAAKSGVARWNDVDDFWDLTIKDGLGVAGSSATRTGVAPGYFSVGGESVMDFILVLPKVFLSGAYDANNNVMRTDLTSLLPTDEPYNGLGFTHAGLGGGETSSGFADIVDWVFVEIREPNAPYDIIGTCSALLKSNGDVIPTASSTELMLPGFASSDSYRIAIRHRNHLGVMSNAAVSGNRSIAQTSDMINNDVFGTNGALFDDSVYQLWSGDVTGNGEVKYIGTGNDRSPILSLVGSTDLTNTINGYLRADLNLDGQVKYIGSGNDRSIILSIIGSSDLTRTILTQIPN